MMLMAKPVMVPPTMETTLPKVMIVKSRVQSLLAGFPSVE